MKLWILRPNDGSAHWKQWYDKAFGFVVRAETEQRARELAAKEAGDEDWSNSLFRSKGDTAAINPWLSEQESSCEELLQDGPEELIMQDFASA